MSDEIKKGLLGIVVDETTISHVVPELSALTYRGYKVQDLCDKCDFEEVAFLVLHGELPSKIQLKKFIKEERSNRRLSKTIIKSIQQMPKNAHPMGILSSLTSLEDVVLVIIAFIILFFTKAPQWLAVLMLSFCGWGITLL